MIVKLKLLVLILLVLGCNEKRLPEENKNLKSEGEINKAVLEGALNTEVNVENFPLIKDSVKFIKQLRDVFGLEEYESESQKTFEHIKLCKKIKLFGSNDVFYFLEYDLVDGCGASFPWKYQFLLSEKGKPIAKLGGIRYEFVTILKNQNPYLLIVNSTYKGNGGHEIYKIANDTVENVFDGFSDYFPRTYDIHEDNHINSPGELKMKIIDKNKDNLNDFVFYGHIISGNEKVPVSFVFLYNKKSGHFEGEEDYSKKYMYLEEL
jgi:hypothetical protein